mgnify:CR=1 FL=1
MTTSINYNQYAIIPYVNYSDFIRTTVEKYQREQKKEKTNQIASTSFKETPDTQSVTLTLVRHGETTWNAIKRIQGQLSYYTEQDGTVVPITLSDKGRQQAEQIEQKLRTMKFSRCYSSDLKRAVDTAIIVTKNLNLPILQDSRLRERSRGEWEGKFESEFSKASQAEKQNIEGDESMCERIFSFLNHAAAENPNGTVLVVVHERVI